MDLMAIRRKLNDNILMFLFNLYSKWSLVLLFFIGFFFSYQMFTNYKNDTSAVTNTSFVMLASMCSLSFAAARAIDGEENVRKDYVYAGERCLHGALLMLFSSALKYLLCKTRMGMTLGSLQ